MISPSPNTKQKGLEFLSEAWNAAFYRNELPVPEGKCVSMGFMVWLSGWYRDEWERRMADMIRACFPPADELFG